MKDISSADIIARGYSIFFSILMSLSFMICVFYLLSFVYIWLEHDKTVISDNLIKIFVCSYIVLSFVALLFKHVLAKKNFLLAYFILC